MVRESSMFGQLGMGQGVGDNSNYDGYVNYLCGYCGLRG